MDDDTLEILAELEHEQWCEWAGVISREMSSLLDIIDNSDAELTDEERQTILNTKRRLANWEGLMIPYSELSEEEKDKDRVYARKMLSIFEE